MKILKFIIRTLIRLSVIIFIGYISLSSCNSMIVGLG